VVGYCRGVRGYRLCTMDLACNCVRYFCTTLFTWPHYVSLLLPNKRQCMVLVIRILLGREQCFRIWPRLWSRSEFTAIQDLQLRVRVLSNRSLFWFSISSIVFFLFQWIYLSEVRSVWQSCEKRLLASCLSVLPFAWNNWAQTGPLFMKFDSCLFFENLSRKLKFRYNLTRITWIPTYILDPISLGSFYRGADKSLARPGR
jgi:hypothetical protein